jgi:hypothetical protein
MRTVTAPPGPRVVGQGRQRDGGRSPHRAPAYRWGQTWGGLAGLVQWPCATRPWALPVLVALVPPSSVGACARHAASAPSTSRPAAAGAPATRGSGASRHFCGGHRGRHERDRAVLPSIPPSPPPGAHVLGRGRPVGAAAPAHAPHERPPAGARPAPRLSPQEVVAWYRGTSKDSAIVTSTGPWDRIGEDWVAVRWVYVHDCTGTPRDEYWFTPNLRLCPQPIVACYTQRWSLEPTVQECREYLKLESPKG